MKTTNTNKPLHFEDVGINQHAAIDSCKIKSITQDTLNFEHYKFSRYFTHDTLQDVAMIQNLNNSLPKKHGYLDRKPITPLSKHKIILKFKTMCKRSLCITAS